MLIDLAFVSANEETLAQPERPELPLLACGGCETGENYFSRVFHPPSPAIPATRGESRFPVGDPGSHVEKRRRYAILANVVPTFFLKHICADEAFSKRFVYLRYFFSRRS